MNFLNIGYAMYQSKHDTKAKFNGGKMFAVGVKNTSCSVENLERALPQMKKKTMTCMTTLNTTRRMSNEFHCWR